MTNRSPHRFEPASAGRFAALCAVSLLVVACGEGTKERGSTSTQGDVAGGETSEFSGGNIAFCPEEGATYIPLDLAAPGIASWLPLAEGQHELPLRWSPQFAASAAVSGYEEHTNVVLDVHVVSARDVVFGEANLGYEGSGCKGSRQRRFELAVDLRTADGALAGSFTHWVSPVTNPELPGGRYLASTSKAGNGSYPLASFSSALALDVDLGEATEQARDLQVFLTLYVAGLRGALGVQLTTWGPNAWGYVSPIAARFPDDGCELALPVPLDERAGLLVDTPRGAYRRVRAQLERSPVPALWRETLEPPRAGRSTEVTLSAGEPTHACRDFQGIYVEAPLTVQSADGLVNHTQTMATRVYVAGGGAGGVGSASSGNVPLVPSADFARITGLADFDLGDSAYGGVALRSAAAPDGSREGTLSATDWLDGEERPIEPTLAWCDGPECARFWCGLGYRVSECP